MKKLHAVILLFPLMSLLAGTMWLPSHCPIADKKECPMMAKMHGKCTMAMAGRTRGQNEQKGKGEGKGNAGCASCIDCPLCCLVTFKPVFRWEFTGQVTIVDYTVMSDNNLDDYFKKHWKPPNGAFLS